MTHLITHIGDLAVLLPVAIVLGIALWRFESGGAAAYFGCTLATCLIVMGISKLFFLSCGRGLDSGIVSPSGHAAASTFVIGSFATVCATQASSNTVRFFTVGCAMGLIAMIASSRVLVGVHSTTEVIVGIVIGALTCGAFVKLYRPLPHPNFNVAALALVIVVVSITLHGQHLPVERTLRKWSVSIRNKTDFCRGVTPGQ